MRTRLAKALSVVRLLLITAGNRYLHHHGCFEIGRCEMSGVGSCPQAQKRRQERCTYVIVLPANVQPFRMVHDRKITLDDPYIVTPFNAKELHPAVSRRVCCHCGNCARGENIRTGRNAGACATVTRVLPMCIYDKQIRGDSALSYADKKTGSHIARYRMERKQT